MATFNETGSGGIVLQGLAILSDRVIFDGPNRLIIINGTENISVQEDIYSGWVRNVLRNVEKYELNRTFAGLPEYIWSLFVSHVVLLVFTKVNLDQ